MEVSNIRTIQCSEVGRLRKSPRAQEGRFGLEGEPFANTAPERRAGHLLAAGGVTPDLPGESRPATPILRE